jgi:mannose-6-phosphate isomerase-like protein (cupin superfamily)
VRAGQREEFEHKHRDTEEICFIVRGYGRIRLDDEILDLAPFDPVRIGAR